MDLNFSAAEQAFRDEVRGFLAQQLAPRLAERVRTGQRLSRADMQHWHATLNARGWLAPHWPRAYGGTDWSVVQKFIFEHDCCMAGAPRVVPFGVNMLGPVLIAFGTEAQQRHWLPRILDGSDWWCQGYSEPEAGSDLAALKTTAVRDGDHYVVNGQKTWTTLAQHANMIFCLVRTAPQSKKQEGISFLLIDMNSPGVEHRPIVTLDGEREVNEVFFNDVRVPLAHLVGEENKGWTCAKYLLTYERTNIAGIGFALAAMARLQQLAKEIRASGRPLVQEPLFAARLARLEIELDNTRTTHLRQLAAVVSGGAPGAESSLLKIRGTQLRQEMSSLLRRALGPYAQPWLSEALDEGFSGEPVGPAGTASAAAQYFNLRKLSIYGGSNEIQRNIVAKTILGL